MIDEKPRRDKYTISFSTTTNRWNIKNKANKTILFSFESEERASNFLNSIFNFPFKNNNDDTNSEPHQALDE